MIEVTIRCGCTRTMRADGRAGGRYLCGCGASVTVSGLPRFDAAHCPLPRGNRICNGPKLPEYPTCQPCSVMIARLTMADPESAAQIAVTGGLDDYNRARDAEARRLREVDEERLAAAGRRDEARKVCVVYYCLLRPGVVKIGTTIQLAERMRSFRVPVDAVLAAEPGHYGLEKLRHGQFADKRTDRAREDYRLDDELQAHIDKVRAAHGDPFELVARTLRKQRKLAEDPNSELPFGKVG